jgi:hypothetical protein
MKLVYYSLANAAASRHEQQWTQSIRTLRRYNSSIDVTLFLYNGASTEMFEEAARQRVTVRYVGNYSEYLDALYVQGSALAVLPTFHKFLSLAQIPLNGVTQILYIDCDTYFFDDVEILFRRYASSDWYAREEPGSQRSHFGYDPSHIDEAALSQIVQSENLRAIIPFNTGVCLMNNGAWQKLDRIRVSYLDFAWRLLCGCQLGIGHTVDQDPAIRSAVMLAMNDVDRGRALPFPSGNLWIIDEIALWLALGHFPELSTGLLSREDAAQGGEFVDASAPSGKRAVLAHYFSNMQDEFFRTLRSGSH